MGVGGIETFWAEKIVQVKLAILTKILNYAESLHD